jgi:uncharacterized UBP type Zn finger protein
MLQYNGRDPCIERLKKLFLHMQNSNAIDQTWLKETLSSLFSALGNIYTLDIESDAREFMLNLLDFIENKFSGSTKSFRGKNSTTIASQNLEISKTEDPFTIISLPLKDFTSLVRMVVDLFHELEMDYVLENESSVPAKMSMKIADIPEIVALSPNLLVHGSKTGTQIKLKNSISISFELDLGLYCSNEQKVDLELVALNVHIGNGSSGHYVAFVRDENNSQWILFNDLEPSPKSMSKEDMIKGYFHTSSCPSYGGFASPYLLIYRHKKGCHCSKCKK